MRRALLVGIDGYEDAPLSGCVNDALRMKTLLSRHEDDEPNFECVTLTSPGATITKAMLLKHIDQLFAHDAEVALLYFSGHGTENNLGGYLVTPDARRYNEGVSMTEVITLANNSKAREVVIILDCCHSGAIGGLPALGNANAAAHLHEGVSILTASRSTQLSVEVEVDDNETVQGLFTALVCAALDGGAADVVGNVTVASIYAYVDQSLGWWGQRPLFKAHVARLASLRRCKPLVPSATLRKLPEWFVPPDFEHALDPSYEPSPHGQRKKPEDRHEEHERIFKCLQNLRDAKLVVPVGEEHLYYAAMHSTSCRLTPLGLHYWRLANEGRI
ncbi:MAG TPA: caspase family protein [Herpetosiphonaceae bacterium]|nr:caspase family protein [Herpetosiphonaceae bacterium]